MHDVHSNGRPKAEPFFFYDCIICTKCSYWDTWTLPNPAVNQSNQFVWSERGALKRRLECDLSHWCNEKEHVIWRGTNTGQQTSELLNPNVSQSRAPKQSLPVIFKGLTSQTWTLVKCPSFQPKIWCLELHVFASDTKTDSRLGNKHDF